MGEAPLGVVAGRHLQSAEHLLFPHARDPGQERAAMTHPRAAPAAIQYLCALDHGTLPDNKTVGLRYSLFAPSSKPRTRNRWANKNTNSTGRTASRVASASSGRKMFTC